MRKNEITVKSILAIFIVVFGLSAMVFVKLENMVIGALIGIVGAVVGYYFGSSSGSTTKDKIIQDNQKTEI